MTSITSMAQWSTRRNQVILQMATKMSAHFSQTLRDNTVCLYN